MEFRAGKRVVRAGVAALALAAAGWAHAAYVFTTVDLPGGTSSQGFDVNNNGVFVGTGSIGDAGRAYVVNGGSTTVLTGPAGALGASGLGISDGGTVVGSYYSTLVSDGMGNLVPGPSTGYIYAGGSYSSFAVAGAQDTFLRGISPNGRYVTGYSVDAANVWNSFVYDTVGGLFTTIVSSPLLTIAQGVTDGGLVMGNRIVPGAPLQREAFTYDLSTGTLSFFQIAGAIDTRYRGIADDGTIGGWYRDGSGIHGFVGSAASYTTIDVPGAISTYVEGINNLGWLAGIYEDSQGVFHGYLAKPVPLPSTLALLLVGLGLVVRKRR